MSGFMSAMKSTLNDEFNVSVTENGAIGYRTTGKELLDLNFAVASLRKASPSDIANRFVRAFFEDKITAMKWLFFARDVRGGLGERRLFRIVFQRMAEENPEYIIPLLPLVPEYGRYDDLWCLFDTKLAPNVLNIIAQQLREDIQNLSDGNGIPVAVEPNKTVLNIFGQLDYGRDKYRKYTDYVALTKAFDEIRSKYHNKSFAFPYGFGCGLANGDWNIVENMLNTYFGDMNVTIYRLSARSDEV